MNMLVLKMSVVPLVIAVVSLAGRRWGTHVAGLLSGFPVVGGPITVFIAAEQGLPFGTQAAIAAIMSVTCLLSFNVAYSWICRRHGWPQSLVLSTLVWAAVAVCLAQLPMTWPVAVSVTVAALLLAPYLFAPAQSGRPAARSGRDLPMRMGTGAGLTLLITAIAAHLGPTWSGMIAAFPIIGLVLVLFTHISQGAGPVAFLMRGNVQGLYSFVAFFSMLVWVWPHGSLWAGVLLAIPAAFAAQGVVQAAGWCRRRTAVR
ncbi:hypothetical protein E9531_10665 [Lampropedia puyangensis]|uniref:Uncharacterized protein n=1 Tax=Lampropedia puyangensis TaxID=1330072 RepID=A0A4V4GQZ9_9BURK|nr:hypothetical protein [Lampropedia puyangensis]THU00226.1 hypothetical protein E9531_10665 [Lampropedia puyangensis]